MKARLPLLLSLAVLAAAPASARSHRRNGGEAPAPRYTAASVLTITEPYRPSRAAASLPADFALGFGIQFGLPEDDVDLFRLGLFGAEHHNVGGVDLNLTYGYASGEARAFQLAPVNVVEGPLTGVQLGIVNVTGVLRDAPSVGGQLGLLVNYADGMDGVQAALLVNRAGTGSGVQLAAGCNFSDRYRGLQLALVNLDGDDVHGAQIGLINVGAKVFSGLQFGAFNGTPDGSFDGWQVGLLNTADVLSGVQFGLVNLADRLDGWQIGLYNDARASRGVQIGLLNRVVEDPHPWLPFLRLSF